MNVLFFVLFVGVTAKLQLSTQGAIKNICTTGTEGHMKHITSGYINRPMNFAPQLHVLFIRENSACRPSLRFSEQISIKIYL